MSLSSTKRRGFTVIELLAVLTLSSLLVAVLLSVTVNVSNVTRSYQSSMPFDNAAFALKRQLQAEFAASRDISVSSSHIQLDGYYRSTENGIGHSPTTIRYEVHRTERERWLVRREIDLLGNFSDRESVQFVSRDFSHFEFLSEISDSVARPQLKLVLHKIDRESSSEKPTSRIWFTTVLIRHGATQ